MITASSLPVAFLMNQTPMELFHHGGPIMWPILIVSLIGLTVVVERVLFIIRETPAVSQRSSKRFWSASKPAMSTAPSSSASAAKTSLPAS
jgi:biopolymer transport protein ExbB/TolQ